MKSVEEIKIKGNLIFVSAEISSGKIESKRFDTFKIGYYPTEIKSF